MALRLISLALVAQIAGAAASAQPAIEAFTSWCFKAGQTPAQAHQNMEKTAGSPLPFTLVFWDKSLAATPNTPKHAERRCEVQFDGDHVVAATTAVTAKMAAPPVFGTPIQLPKPYLATAGTALIQARELLRGRIAVVEIGLMDGPQTYIRVDRLPAGMGLPS